MGNLQSTGRDRLLPRTPLSQINESRRLRSTEPVVQSNTDSASTSNERTRSGPTTFSRPSSRFADLDEDSVRAAPDDLMNMETEEQYNNQIDTNGMDFEAQPMVTLEETENTAMDLSETRSLMRSSSTMSRLGTRLLPDNVMRGLLNSGEETAEEGEALRQGISSRRRPPAFERRAPSISNDRFSVTGSIRRRMPSRADSRRSVRDSFSFGGSTHEHMHAVGTDEIPTSVGEGQSMSSAVIERRTRFHRMRNSLAQPFSGLFGHRQSRFRDISTRTPTPHPARHQSSEEENSLLNQSELQFGGDGYASSSRGRGVSGADDGASNPTARIASSMASIRRFPHNLRSRSTRVIRRGEHPSLSQVLQLAAAAIAAQLSGHAGMTNDTTRPFGDESFDGSIQNFVQTLQDAASAQAGESADLNTSDGELPPVNFMRVFQFPNDENGTPMAPLQTRDQSRTDVDTNNDQDRSVTLVLVGVRSMPNVSGAATTQNGVSGPSLDTLLSMPFLPPANVLRSGSSGALFRRADTRTSTDRRHSMTNFNFPAQYESQRHQRSRTLHRAATGDQPSVTSNHHTSLSVSESPPGPVPPPSTPADIRSGHATPIRRPSSPSTMQSPLLPDLDEDDIHHARHTHDENVATTARQRRRSDSDFARRPELASGAARRNGVVEPDRSSGGGRSWLIYVVGTNVSPDHPAFTMPSLFTDNPSYEDMQMLSTLLGPAKPPVASQNDINSAGGTLCLVKRDDILVAEAVGREHFQTPIALTPGDRCLICLADYEVLDELRQLNDCQHLFHRGCIDEWLTTGRNSCPMCRAQGVKETPGSDESTEPITTSSDPTA